MERFAIKKMLAWKQSSRRKPLILKGVRQVGKTWILKEFGRRYYKTQNLGPVGCITNRFLIS